MTQTITLREAFDLHYHKAELRRSSLGHFASALLKWEQFTSNPPITDIDNATVDQFRTAALAGGLAGRTINGYWTAIRSILHRLGPPETGNPWGMGLIARVPAMRLCKVEFHRPRRLTMDEMDRTYLAAGRMRKPVRNVPDAAAWWRALLVVAYTTALRSADLFHLKWTDLNDAESTLFVKVRKTGVSADLPLSPAAMAHLGQLNRDRETIFSIDRAHCYTCWTELQKLAGVDFGFHDIRRTAASEIDRVDRGLGKVLLLHAPGNVTDRSYVNSLPDLRAAVEKMETPLTFRHGVKMVERQLKAVRREALKPADFAVPMRPPREAFQFLSSGFRFNGREYLLTGLHLAMLRCLVETDGATAQAQLWSAVDQRPFDPASLKCRSLLADRLDRLRKKLRRLLGIPRGFNPVVGTSRPQRTALCSYHLLLPPALWDAGEVKGGAT